MPSATSGIQLMFARLFPAVKRSAEPFSGPNAVRMIILRQGDGPLKMSTLSKTCWLSGFYDKGRKLRNLIGLAEVYYLDNLATAGEDVECMSVLLQSQLRGIIIEKLIILEPTAENLAKMNEGIAENDHYAEGDVRGRREAMRINTETKEAMMTYGCNIAIANAAIEKAVGSVGVQMDAPRVAVVQTEIALIAKHLFAPANLPEEGAEVCFDKVSHGAGDVRYLLKLALLYIGEGDFDQAVAYLNRGLARVGIDGPAEQLYMLYYNLGLAYFAKGEGSIAGKEFLAARRIAPARTEIQAFLTDAVSGAYGDGAKEKAETIKRALGIS